MRTADITDALLAYWVGRALGFDVTLVKGTPEEMPVERWFVRRWADIAGERMPHDFDPLKWGTGGPIMEADRISLLTVTVNMGTAPPAWVANIIGMPAPAGCGRTMLEAAMRAKVASVYGDTVPDEIPA